jgi:hypothetical protein
MRKRGVEIHRSELHQSAAICGGVDLALSVRLMSINALTQDDLC